MNRAHLAYDRGRAQGLGTKAGRRRDAGKHDARGEAALLAGFAKAAGAGEILNIHDLKAAYEKAIGHRTSDSTVYSRGAECFKKGFF